MTSTESWEFLLKNLPLFLGGAAIIFSFILVVIAGNISDVANNLKEISSKLDQIINKSNDESKNG